MERIRVHRYDRCVKKSLELTEVKLVLLHDQKNDDGIRLFLIEVWELYVKVRASEVLS